MDPTCQLATAAPIRMFGVTRASCLMRSAGGTRIALSVRRSLAVTGGEPGAVQQAGR
jgi:hypothetical protein